MRASGDDSDSWDDSKNDFLRFHLVAQEHEVAAGRGTVAGDATFGLALGHLTGEHHALWIGVEAAVGFELGPKPVFGFRIVAGAFQHHGYRLEIFCRVVGDIRDADAFSPPNGASMAPALPIKNATITKLTILNDFIKSPPGLFADCLSFDKPYAGRLHLFLKMDDGAEIGLDRKIPVALYLHAAARVVFGEV